MDFKEWTSITSNKTENFLVFGPCVVLDKLWRLSLTFEYHKVASSRPVYYLILELLEQRSQYISIKFPLHKPTENLKMCYSPRHTTAHDVTVVSTQYMCTDQLTPGVFNFSSHTVLPTTFWYQN